MQTYTNHQTKYLRISSCDSNALRIDGVRSGVDVGVKSRRELVERGDMDQLFPLRSHVYISGSLIIDSHSLN